MKLPQPYHFEIAELIHKFLTGTLTVEESDRLEAWTRESKENQQIFQHMTDPTYVEAGLEGWEKAKDAEWERLIDSISERAHPGRRILHRSMRYAAVLIPLILLCAGGWYFYNKHAAAGQQGAGETLAGVTIMPKGKVARLVLGNGQVIRLNDSIPHQLTEKDGTEVSNHASELSYAAGRRSGDEVVYNTLMTPRGGEYQVRLSDGTLVWLNASSSLRYPTKFRGRERTVYLRSGEAYFEVARDVKHPFIVHAGKATVKVLGTKFDISSYEDDPRQKVTLQEGGVYVNEAGLADKNGVTLKPGYQVVIDEEAHHFQLNKVNLEAVLAWKNGLFVFDNETLGSLMRRLSRWYDVDVVYERGVDTLFHFAGRIKRYENITGILHLLQYTGKVRFELRERVLHVLPGQGVSTKAAGLE